MARSETPTFLSDSKTSTSVGTAVAIGTSQRVKSLVIVAKDNNTDAVYVGGSDVGSATNRGLLPGDALSIPAVNWLDLANVYIDVKVSGEGVDYYAVKA